MKRFFIINDLSTYRSELMGWAILWIMMLHYTFNQIPVLGFIAQYGFAGVDIFMLVSGMGLFFSLEKDNHIIRFYKKRLLRIFPTYYLLGIIYSLFLFQDTIINYLFRYTTIGFWTGGIYGEWYVPSIVMLYIFAPLIKKVIDETKFGILIIIVCIILILAYYLVDKEYILDRAHFFFLYRIPAFIMGMACAYWINQDNNKYFIYIMIVGIPIFVFLFPQHHAFYLYKYLSLLFLLPFFTLCFIFISKHLGRLRVIIIETGKASLEIYLIQGMFFYAIITHRITIPASYHDAITIFLIVLCTAMGIFAHWLIGKSRINSIF